MTWKMVNKMVCVRMCHH